MYFTYWSVVFLPIGVNVIYLLECGFFTYRYKCNLPTGVEVFLPIGVDVFLPIVVGVFYLLVLRYFCQLIWGYVLITAGLMIQ